MAIGFVLALLAYRRMAPPPLAEPRAANLIAFWIVVALAVIGTALALKRWA